MFVRVFPSYCIYISMIYDQSCNCYFDRIIQSVPSRYFPLLHLVFLKAIYLATWQIWQSKLFSFLFMRLNLFQHNKLHFAENSIMAYFPLVINRIIISRDLNYPYNYIW